MRRDLRKTEFDGRWALITGTNHPHKGDIAICLGAILNPRTRMWQMMFKSIKSDIEFTVNGGGDIKWIVNKQK